MLVIFLAAVFQRGLLFSVVFLHFFCVFWPYSSVGGRPGSSENQEGRYHVLFVVVVLS